MKHLLLTLFYFAFLFSSIKSSAKNAELKPFVFNSTIQAREARADQYDKAIQSSSHSELQFVIDQQPVIRAGQIQVTGELLNSSVSRITVYLRGKDSTLLVEPKESDQVKLRTDLPRPPKSDPPLFVLDVPPKSRTQFTGTTDLGLLKYSGAPNLKLNWVFQYWTSPRPNGTVEVKLPTVDQANLPKLKIEIERFNSSGSVTKGTLAKVTANLRNISNDPQLFCHRSQESFEWRLLGATGAELPNKKLRPPGASAKALSDTDCSTLAPGASIELDTANLLADESSYVFRTKRWQLMGLTKGTYELHFNAENAAAKSPAGDDAKLVKRLLESSHAASPVANVETSVPFSIP